MASVSLRRHLISVMTRFIALVAAVREMPASVAREAQRVRGPRQLAAKHRILEDVVVVDDRMDDGLRLRRVVHEQPAEVIEVRPEVVAIGDALEPDLDRCDRSAARCRACRSDGRSRRSRSSRPNPCSTSSRARSCLSSRGCRASRRDRLVRRQLGKLVGVLVDAGEIDRVLAIADLLAPVALPQARPARSCSGGGT